MRPGSGLRRALWHRWSCQRGLDSGKAAQTAAVKLVASNQATRLLGREGVPLAGPKGDLAVRRNRQLLGGVSRMRRRLVKGVQQSMMIGGIANIAGDSFLTGISTMVNIEAAIAPTLLIEVVGPISMT